MNWKLGVWIAATIAVAAVLAGLVFAPESIEPMTAAIAPTTITRAVFLPGKTTDGHYQIELACDGCHTEAFSDVESMQQACVDCHGGELDRADDSHPQRKFTDPRNADRVEVLDARWCITCHQEHRPEVTSTMGLSLPVDYCFRCHEGIGEDRPTHAELGFDTCATSGCHNFHDNRALYEDFLVEHRAEPAIWDDPRVDERELRAWALTQGFAKPVALTAAENDAPPETPELTRWVEEWAGTSHAAAGVNCSGCHAPEGLAWTDEAPASACQGCHEAEGTGFAGGRHGMRAAAGLGPMRPELARLPMHADQDDATLGCNTCHSAHAYDTQHAAADACTGCHADEHTLAWEDSKHAALWRAEVAGQATAGSGVSCATCHMPRIEAGSFTKTTRVAHNQNDYLRPNEKMIRAACMDCHGLGFSLDSLADPALVANNFQGRATRSVESIHYASVLRWELEGRSPPWTHRTDEEK